MTGIFFFFFLPFLLLCSRCGSVVEIALLLSPPCLVSNCLLACCWPAAGSAIGARKVLEKLRIDWPAQPDGREWTSGGEFYSAIPCRCLAIAFRNPIPQSHSAIPPPVAGIPMSGRRVPGIPMAAFQFPRLSVIWRALPCHSQQANCQRIHRDRRPRPGSIVTPLPPPQFRVSG